jgi:hypothetical protein
MVLTMRSIAKSPCPIRAKKQEPRRNSRKPKHPQRLVSWLGRISHNQVSHPLPARSVNRGLGDVDQ